MCSVEVVSTKSMQRCCHSRFLLRAAIANHSLISSGIKQDDGLKEQCLVTQPHLRVTTFSGIPWIGKGIQRAGIKQRDDESCRKDSRIDGRMPLIAPGTKHLRGASVTLEVKAEMSAGRPSMHSWTTCAYPLTDSSAHGRGKNQLSRFQHAMVHDLS